MSNNKMKNQYISAASITNDESPKPVCLQCQAKLPSASLEMFNISTCNMAKHFWANQYPCHDRVAKSMPWYDRVANRYHAMIALVRKSKSKHTSDQINIRAMIEMHVDVDAMLPWQRCTSMSIPCVDSLDQKKKKQNRCHAMTELLWVITILR